MSAGTKMIIFLIICLLMLNISFADETIKEKLTQEETQSVPVSDNLSGFDKDAARKLLTKQYIDYLKLVLLLTDAQVNAIQPIVENRMGKSDLPPKKWTL